MQHSLRRILFFVLLLHLGLLVWVAATLPIGPSEAKIYFTAHTPVSVLMHLGHTLLPRFDFLNIRLPFLLLHLINLALFWELTAIYNKDETARIFSFLIFLLLPGIVSSAVLVTSTGMILALYQLFLLLYMRRHPVAAYLILPLFLLIDRSALILYFALLTYALWNRERGLLIFSGTLFLAALSIYGVDFHGKPVNHFVDTVALYAAIFSPLLFLYFFYAIYRILLKGRHDLLWHVAFTVLVLSLAISMRQRIPIQDFAPYVVVAIPMMTELFLSSYRVRLPQFRRTYRNLAFLVLGVLLLNTLILLIHRPLFLILKHPRKHFAAPFYYPYWCARALQRAGIDTVVAPDSKTAYQLAYYGIGKGGLKLSFHPSQGCRKVTIRYEGRTMGYCCVSKLNNSTENRSNPSLSKREVNQMVLNSYNKNHKE